MDGAPVVNVSPFAFAVRVHMAAQHQEQVRIHLEPVVDGLSLRAEGAALPAVHDPMADQDALPVAVRLEQLIGPGQLRRVGRRGRVILKVNHDELDPAGLEQLEVVVVVRAVVASVIGPPEEVSLAKILVVERGGASRGANGRLVVVAHRHAVGDAEVKEGGQRILQLIERVGGGAPFDVVPAIVPVLHAVAELRHKRDVARRGVGHDPIGLRLEDRWAAAVEAGGIELRVGQGDDGEVRPHRRCRPPHEGHGHGQALAMRDRHIQGGRKPHLRRAMSGRVEGDLHERPFARQFQIKGDVRTVRRRLMDLHGQHIRALRQKRRADAGLVKRAFVRAPDRDGRQRGGGDGSCRQVVPVHLCAVQVHDHAIVANNSKGQAGEPGRVGDIEGTPEIGGDVLVVRVGTVADDGGLPAIAIPELGRTGSPGGIIERRSHPRRAEVRPGIEVFPNRTGRKQSRGGRRREGRTQCEQWHEDDHMKNPLTIVTNVMGEASDGDIGSIANGTPSTSAIPRNRVHGAHEPSTKKRGHKRVLNGG